MPAGAFCPFFLSNLWTGWALGGTHLSLQYMVLHVVELGTRVSLCVYTQTISIWACPSPSLRLSPTCEWQTPLSAPLLVLGSSFGVSVGHIGLSSYNGGICSQDQPASTLNESALNRNIATILLSFQSSFIILLAPPIQEWPDKSAAQWAARWRGSSGVWMALACVLFERAAVLFSAVSPVLLIH